MLSPLGSRWARWSGSAHRFVRERLGSALRGARGATPTVGSASERLAIGVAVSAGVAFAAAAAWGMFLIPGGGHIGAGSAGTTMMAEQMLRWKLAYPAFGWYEPGPPSPVEYYCHHPFGMYWLSAVALALFGHQHFVVYLPAVLLSAGTVPLVYGIGKHYGGRTVGAVAALAYAVVPINVGFANFHNLEVPCIFGALLFFWAHARHERTGQRRFLALSLLGLAITTAADWVGYLMAAPLLAFALVRGFVLPARWSASIAFGPFARWWALSVALSLGSLLVWIGLFAHADKLGDWLSSGTARGGGDVVSLSEVLERRRSWLELSFTPLAITLGKIGAVLSAIHCLWRRRDSDVYPLAVLFGASVQYVVFKRGADVHLFWPHYFGAYYALVLAHALALLQGGVGWLAHRLERPRLERWGAPLLFAVGLLPSLLMLPDAWRGLRLLRQTGGRYNDNGTLIRTHRDLLTVLERVVRPRLPAAARVEVHPSAAWGWEHFWAARASEHVTLAVPEPLPHAADPLWIARASGMTLDFQRRVLRQNQVAMYGDTWVVDRRRAPGPLQAYSLGEREPNWFECLLYGGIEPMRDVSSMPDPLATWEWRLHFGQPAPIPSGRPETLEQARVLHNLAVERGDATGARRLRSGIEQELARGAAARFTHDLRLVGTRVVGEAKPSLEIWFEAGEPLPADATFEVISTVVRNEPLSLVPADRTPRRMAWPPSLNTGLWRRGFLYKVDVVLNHRIGRERYVGFWVSPRRGRAPEPIGRSREIELLVLD